MFERFTNEAREIVVRARIEALELQHSKIGTEHLLLAATQDPGRTGEILRAAGLDAAGVRAAIQRAVAPAAPILDEDDMQALRSVGIDVDAVMARIEQSFGPQALRAQPPSRRGWFGRVRNGGGGMLSPRAKKVLELSLREAVHLQSREIASGHLVLGLLREGEGLAARIMVDAGADLTALRTQTEQSLRRAA